MKNELWRRTIGILNELNIEFLTEQGTYRKFNEVMLDIQRVYERGTDKNKELIRKLFVDNKIYIMDEPSQTVYEIIDEYGKYYGFDEIEFTHEKTIIRLNEDKHK